LLYLRKTIFSSKKILVVDNFQRIQPWIQNFLGGSTLPIYVLRSTVTTRLKGDYTWTEISDKYEIELELLLNLNPKLKNIKKLRAGTVIIIPGKALNVSYSEEGLKWTASQTRLHYFKNNVRLETRTTSTPDGELKVKVVMVGDMTVSPNVFIERFIPRNHVRDGYMDRDAQVSEFLWVDKALRMHYVPRGESPEMENDVVDI